MPRNSYSICKKCLSVHRWCTYTASKRLYFTVPKFIQLSVKMIMCVKFIYSITWADHIHSFHKTTIKSPIILTCSFVLMYSEYMKRWLVIFLTFFIQSTCKHKMIWYFDKFNSLCNSLCWTRVNEVAFIYK